MVHKVIHHQRRFETTLFVCRFVVLPLIFYTISSAPIPPYNLLLSTSLYLPPTSSPNSVVGSLSALDYNVADSFTLSIAGGAAASLFDVVGSNLVFRNAGQTGMPLEVVVRVTDSAGLFLDRQFFVNEGSFSLPLFPSAHFSHGFAAANVAPTNITLSSTTYAPPLARGVTPIAVLTTTDANCCQQFTYAVVGGADASKFTVNGNMLWPNVNGPGLTGNNLQVIIETRDGFGGVFQRLFSIHESCVSLILMTPRHIRLKILHSQCATDLVVAVEQHLLTANPPI